MTTNSRPRSSLRQGLRAVAQVFGTMLLVTAVAMSLPISCAILYWGEGDLLPLLGSAAISAGVGFPLWWYSRGDLGLGVRHAFVIATFGWVAISAVSAIPFVFHGAIPSYTDAFFEMMSGYTTTGATILKDIEALPHGLLLWRSTTHLLGGMGFITLAVIVLPHGTGGLRLFRAESSPGQVLTKERITSRNRDAMVYLWFIYIGLNLLQILLMSLGGMSLFDSMCHAFGTVSTSGYSTYNASVGHFKSAYFDWVITVFMFLGGTTFVLLFYVARGQFRPLLVNTELRWYLAIVLLFCGAVAAILYFKGTYGVGDALRYGSFQVMSLLTTTGFATADYEQWPYAVQMILVVVMFVGAMAGSTTSGIKVVHYAIMWKFGVALVRKAFFKPLAVISVRLNGQRIENRLIYLALLYFIINVAIVLIGGVIMSLLDNLDPFSAMTSVTACLMNIGPGFGEVGPSKNFAPISDTGKWFLSFLMLVGRLELFSALVLFYPSFWRE